MYQSDDLTLQALLRAAGMTCASVMPDPEEGDLKIIDDVHCTNCLKIVPTVYELQRTPDQLKWRALCKVPDFALFYPDRIKDLTNIGSERPTK